MRPDVFFSGWDTAIVMAPFAALMVLSIFGLDDRLARRSRTIPPRRMFCQVDGQGDPLVRDPDGRICRGGEQHRKPPTE